MRRNDNPPEQHDALEVQVDGHWFAWDADDNVYRHAPNAEPAQREDGYIFIGTLEMPQGAALDEHVPTDTLRDYARQHLLKTCASADRDPRPRMLA
jgi:hypothetical protein